MNPQFVQQPCIKCGATVWIAPAAGVGYCPSCHTPNSIGAAPGVPYNAGGAPQQPQAQQAAPQAQMPQQPMMNPAFAAAMNARRRGPGMIIFGVIGLILLSVIGSIGWYAVKQYAFRASGHDKAKDLGISDAKHADLEKMISETRTRAKRWRSDAELAEINVQAMNDDGTVDLTKSAQIVYFSSGRVKSTATAAQDSVKKFQFNDDALDYSDTWGLKETVPDFEALPDRKCTAAKLGKLMKKKGLKQAHVQMEDIAWHVLGDSDNFWVDATNSDCPEVKPNIGGNDDE